MTQTTTGRQQPAMQARRETLGAIRSPAVAMAALLTFTGLPVLSQAQSIERVEPPFWYQGYQHTELQLMIYGSSLAGMTPTTDQEGIAIARVETGDSPNYLFVYLDIDPSVEPGEFELTLAGDGATLTHRYTLKAKNPDPDHARGFSGADTIYLITPDRFANGNPNNDNDPALGDPVDRSELCGRHGGDIEGIAQSLEYIDEMGFTAIWLNPVLENRMPVCSYHGYSTTDFYAADPRYGSNEEYVALAETARARGIGMIMDMIVNHVGTGHWWMDDLPTEDWLNFPELRPITTHIHATIFDPNGSAYDRQAFSDGWFVDTMPDLNQRNPLLADYLTQNALWWIETLGLTGIRMDTHPYPDKAYMAEWSRRVMEEYPDFTIVGEEWHSSPNFVAYWQRGKENHDGYVSHMPSMMDFPVQAAIVESLIEEKPDWLSSWMALYEKLAHDFVYPSPQDLVIFPDNHDMSRIFTQVGEDQDLWRMAMVMAATLRGTPQIYYGTEILMANRESGDHGLIRSDFPGGWEGDEKNAFTGEGLSEDELEAQAFLRQLLNWRRGAEVVHNGAFMQFAPIGEVYTYFRYNDSGAVMVVMNKNDTAIELPMTRFEERLDGAVGAVDVLGGGTVNLSGPMTLAPRSVRLLEIRY
ncbi:MAG: glycoside hydrolase family 13 protein [Pseudomonadota bacterium]